MEVSLGRTAFRRAAKQVSTVRQYSIVHDVPRSANFVQTPPPPVSRKATTFDDAVNATSARNSWTKEEITEIHRRPLMELAYAAVGTNEAGYQVY